MKLSGIKVSRFKNFVNDVCGNVEGNLGDHGKWIKTHSGDSFPETDEMRLICV